MQLQILSKFLTKTSAQIFLPQTCLPAGRGAKTQRNLVSLKPFSVSACPEESGGLSRFPPKADLLQRRMSLWLKPLAESGFIKSQKISTLIHTDLTDSHRYNSHGFFTRRQKAIFNVQYSISLS
jgi:hypothetical protein